ARETTLADGLDGPALDVASVEPDRPLVGAIEARYHVEQRRLAGTVGSDQGVDLACAELEVRIRGGANATEVLGNADDLEDGAGRSLRAQKDRQRQSFIDLALTHRCSLLGRRTQAPHDRAPDPGEAARREQHESYEDEAEPEQPVRCPD